MSTQSRAAPNHRADRTRRSAWDRNLSLFSATQPKRIFSDVLEVIGNPGSFYDTGCRLSNPTQEQLYRRRSLAGIVGNRTAVLHAASRCATLSALFRSMASTNGG